MATKFHSATENNLFITLSHYKVVLAVVPTDSAITSFWCILYINYLLSSYSSLFRCIFFFFFDNKLNSPISSGSRGWAMSPANIISCKLKTSILTTHSLQWEDHKARERTGYLSSYMPGLRKLSCEHIIPMPALGLTYETA